MLFVLFTMTSRIMNCNILQLYLCITFASLTAGTCTTYSYTPIRDIAKLRNNRSCDLYTTRDTFKLTCLTRCNDIHGCFHCTLQDNACFVCLDTGYKETITGLTHFNGSITALPQSPIYEKDDTDYCALYSPCLSGGTCEAVYMSYICHCTSDKTGPHCETDLSLEDCSKRYKLGERTSGIYQLAVASYGKPIDVYCEMSSAGGGWTVMQRRIDGATSFEQNWQSYKTGFGNLNHEFWIGNDILANMTSGTTRFTVRIDLEDFSGNTRYAEYKDFKVADESLKYKLSLGSYSGNAGNSQGFSYHNGREFSTIDGSSSCPAQRGGGGFWYQSCAWSSLNGRYYTVETTTWHSIYWYNWHQTTSLKYCQMMIRPVNFP